MSESADLLLAVKEIRELLRLMAEPAIAERDQKLRTELRRIVGSSAPKARAVLLMNGGSTQSEIQRETGINKGNLSTLVKQLKENDLLTGDPKNPKLAILIPSNFFESEEGR
jgi:DNA-binding MarR family transcriptional regulator